ILSLGCSGDALAILPRRAPVLAGSTDWLGNLLPTMASQKLGIKKVMRLRRETGLDIIGVLVRGGTDHRQDLCLRDGSIVNLWADGTTTKSESRHALEVPPELTLPHIQGQTIPGTKTNE